MQQQIATQVRQSMAEPRPAVLAYLAEPWSHYGRHGRDPALGRHPGLNLPSLLGIVLTPLPARRLRSMFGVNTSMSAKILSPAEAAGQLAEAIEDVRLLVPRSARHERTLAWLRLASKLPASVAPLLNEPGVRHALLAAIGGAQPMPAEIPNAAA